MTDQIALPFQWPADEDERDFIISDANRMGLGNRLGLGIEIDKSVGQTGVKVDFKVNAETHLPPLLATAARARLEEGLVASLTGAEDSAAQRHHSGLVRAVAHE